MFRVPSVATRLILSAGVALALSSTALAQHGGHGGGHGGGGSHGGGGGHGGGSSWHGGGHDGGHSHSSFSLSVGIGTGFYGGSYYGGSYCGPSYYGRSAYYAPSYCGPAYYGYPVHITSVPVICEPSAIVCPPTISYPLVAAPVVYPRTQLPVVIAQSTPTTVITSAAVFPASPTSTTSSPMVVSDAVPSVSRLDVTPTDLGMSAYRTGDNVLLIIKGTNPSVGYSTGVSVLNAADGTVRLRNTPAQPGMNGSPDRTFTLNSSVYIPRTSSNVMVYIGDQPYQVPITEVPSAGQ